MEGSSSCLFILSLCSGSKAFPLMIFNYLFHLFLPQRQRGHCSLSPKHWRTPHRSLQARSLPPHFHISPSYPSPRSLVPFMLPLCFWGGCSHGCPLTLRAMRVVGPTCPLLEAGTLDLEGKSQHWMGSPALFCRARSCSASSPWPHCPMETALGHLCNPSLSRGCASTLFRSLLHPFSPAQLGAPPFKENSSDSSPGQGRRRCSERSQPPEGSAQGFTAARGQQDEGSASPLRYRELSTGCLCVTSLTNRAVTRQGLTYFSWIRNTKPTHSSHDRSPSPPCPKEVVSHRMSLENSTITAQRTCPSAAARSVQVGSSSDSVQTTAQGGKIRSSDSSDQHSPHFPSSWAPLGCLA
ncbi:uncharacterized protein LOC129735556 [Falco cherrug]|uniref:uncharacterized protein LOC129735556 n=1 Tax=Falco cherrug TaxID=345164 RepID=UPI002479E288|nr:uncharacterized protein LOC129735556 [Falco cherrug]